MSVLSLVKFILKYVPYSSNLLKSAWSYTNLCVVVVVNIFDVPFK